MKKEIYLNTLPEWFMESNYIEAQRYALTNGTAYIIKETEKAVYVHVECGVVSFATWIPKSIINGTYKHREETVPAEKPTTRRLDGLEYHDVLVQYAKDNGIKGVRINLKSSKLREMITKAGFVLPSREVAL